MKDLLRLLADGRFHSGDELGRALGISRSGVWKRLRELDVQPGLHLQRVQGKGYRLAEPLSLLEFEPLMDAAARLLDADLELHGVLDSTNAQAMRRVAARPVRPIVVLSEAQSAGRGRRGRDWISPYGQNLYLSILLPITRGARQLTGLSLVAGMAIHDYLQSVGLAGVGLKWPNDVYVDGRKIAGILLEISGDPNDLCHVVIGIGINVNMLQGPDTIDQPWTSMRREIGLLQDRNAVASGILAALKGYLDRHQQDGFSRMREEWEQRHAWQGRSAILMQGGDAVCGTILGVTEEGALRMRVGGVERSFLAGDLSLRLNDDS